MRETASPETIWLSVGGQIGFHAATILLTALLQQSGELGGIANSEEARSAQECEASLRGLWDESEPPCTPHRLELSEQFTGELADSMLKLPQTDTLEFMRTLNGFPLAHKSPARVGRLKGYGNAIVAQQAQAFIESYMDATHDV